MKLAKPFNPKDETWGVVTDTIYFIPASIDKLSLETDQQKHYFRYLISVLLDITFCPCYCNRISDNPVEVLIGHGDGDLPYIRNNIRCLSCHGRRIAYDIFEEKLIRTDRLQELVKFMAINTSCSCLFFKDIMSEDIQLKYDVEKILGKQKSEDHCTRCNAIENSDKYKEVVLPAIMDADFEIDRGDETHKVPLISLFYPHCVIEEDGIIRIN